MHFDSAIRSQTRPESGRTFLVHTASFRTRRRTQRMTRQSAPVCGQLLPSKGVLRRTDPLCLEKRQALPLKVKRAPSVKVIVERTKTHGLAEGQRQVWAITRVSAQCRLQLEIPNDNHRLHSIDHRRSVQNGHTPLGRLALVDTKCADFSWSVFIGPSPPDLLERHF